MSRPEMPIFTRTFDLLTWLLPMSNHFPRAHRQTATKRLLDAAFDLREAGGGGEPAAWGRAAGEAGGPDDLSPHLIGPLAERW